METRSLVPEDAEAQEAGLMHHTKVGREHRDDGGLSEEFHEAAPPRWRVALAVLGSVGCLVLFAASAFRASSGTTAAGHVVGLNTAVTWAAGQITWEQDNCLDVSGRHTTPGATVNFQKCRDKSSTQRWIVPMHFGLIRSAKLTEYCIAIVGHGESKAGNLDVQRCNESDPSMQWVMPEFGHGPIRWAENASNCIWWGDQEKWSNVAAVHHCDGGTSPGKSPTLFHVPVVKKVTHVAVPAHESLRGQYGYISEFWLESSEIRKRIHEMHETFSISEFQLYAAFEGFSSPPAEGKANWRCALGSRLVHRSALEAATSEIERLGGRSWLYIHAGAIDAGDEIARGGARLVDRDIVHRKVQRLWFELALSSTRHRTETQAKYYETCGCDLPDMDSVQDDRCCNAWVELPEAARRSKMSPELRQKMHQRGCHGRDADRLPERCNNMSHTALLDYAVLDSDWALRHVPKWAKFAKSVGASGIHWDTLGDTGSSMYDGTNIPNFLKSAYAVLSQEGLKQTLNFVDGFGWDRALLHFEGGPLVAFPYWEIWTNPSVEERFFVEVEGYSFVYASYPGFSQFHCCTYNEQQNAEAYGIWPLDLGLARWERAFRSGGSYVFIGDGMRHAQSPFLPDAVSLSRQDAVKIQQRLSRLTVATATAAGSGAQAPQEDARQRINHTEAVV